VPGRKRGRLVEKEKLRPRTRTHELPAPAAILEPARNPAADVRDADDPPFVVVQYAPISQHHTAPGERRELPERRYPILKGHPERRGGALIIDRRILKGVDTRTHGGVERSGTNRRVTQRRSPEVEDRRGEVVAVLVQRIERTEPENALDET